MTTQADLVQRVDAMDGAHWQTDKGAVDFQQVHAASLGKTIWWKSTQGNTGVDPSFGPVRQQIHAIPFDMAFWYHWISHLINPVDQAAHHIKTVGTWGQGEGFMLDGEEAGITVESCLGVMEPIEDVRKAPSDVYTGLYVAGGSIWKDPRIRNSKYGPRGMHLAAYVTPASLWARMVALGVQNLPMYAWQWDSGYAMPGVVGWSDVNAMLDMSLYRALTHAIIVPPVITPPPSYVPQGDIDMARLVTNTQDRVSPADNQSYPARKFKFIVDDYGDIRHITRQAEGVLYPDPAADQTTYVGLDNDALDQWLADTAAKATPGAPTQAFPTKLSGSLQLDAGTFEGTLGT